MFRHHLNKSGSWRTRFDWYLLSFASGSVNAGGLLAAHRFVSHVTGFATLFGVKAGEGRMDEALGILSVPIYFLLGVMTSAYLVDRRERQGKRPLYAWVMALISVCLLLAAVGGHLQWFGEFGSEPRLRQHYFLLALLCAASGLQNAAVSSASGGTVRITHLTGLTTDLGTGLVRAFSDRGAYGVEMRAARHRIGTIAAFALGSTAGAMLFARVEYLGFLLPAAIGAYSVFEALAPMRRLGRMRRLAA